MNAMIAIDTMGKPGLALDIPKNQTFDQWVEMGRSLCEGQRVVNWWIGDWWAAGSHRYGERAAAAAEGIFGKEFQTLRNTASVCRSFETSRRRDTLTFSHHAEVAALPPDRADKLLERAEQERLSTRDLRVEAMKVRVELGHFPTRDVADDDPEHTALVAIARAWNRAPIGARETFADLIEEAGLGEIDP
jgi:hypothetical protein